MPRRVHILADELLDNFVVLGRILDIRQLDSLFRAAGLWIAATIKGNEGRWTISCELWMTKLEFASVATQTAEQLALALVRPELSFEIKIVLVVEKARVEIRRVVNESARDMDGAARIGIRGVTAHGAILASRNEAWVAEETRNDAH